MDEKMDRWVYEWMSKFPFSGLSGSLLRSSLCFHFRVFLVTHALSLSLEGGTSRFEQLPAKG